jgi:hypothetical protein
MILKQKRDKITFVFRKIIPAAAWKVDQRAKMRGRETNKEDAER